MPHVEFGPGVKSKYAADNQQSTVAGQATNDG